MHKIPIQSTLDAVDNISYITGIILSVDYSTDTADIYCGAIHTAVPIFYNCPKAGEVKANGSLENTSHAFERGDEVVVRMYKNLPSHVIGFTDDMWPCIKTPALIFDNSYIYDIETSEFSRKPSEFERYIMLAQSPCSADHTLYINDDNAPLSDGFTSIVSDDNWTRHSDFYFKDELVYSTHNTETTSHVFNGTRSNVFGRYIHPQTEWGCMVYQINTFYEWLPQVSGHVDFDYYLYTSTGLNEKIASASVDITGATSYPTGDVVASQSCKSLADENSGDMLLINIQISEAASFLSDGSTNEVSTGDLNKTKYALVTEGAETPLNKQFTINTDSFGHININGDAFDSATPEIYVKNR